MLRNLLWLQGVSDTIECGCFKHSPCEVGQNGFFVVTLRCPQNAKHAAAGAFACAWQGCLLQALIFLISRYCRVLDLPSLR